jgi:hypothetical protein
VHRLSLCLFGRPGAVVEPYFPLCIVTAMVSLLCFGRLLLGFLLCYGCRHKVACACMLGPVGSCKTHASTCKLPCASTFVQQCTMLPLCVLHAPWRRS